jgi:hypothetical protein
MPGGRRSRSSARKARDGEQFLPASLVRMPRKAKEKRLVASEELLATKEPARRRRYKGAATMEQRRTQPQQLRSRPQNYVRSRRPLPFSPAEISAGFSRNLLDTRCRTAAHPSDSKQKIGVMLTRHTKELSPQQVFHSNPAPAHPSWLYAQQDEERSRSLVRFAPQDDNERHRAGTEDNRQKRRRDAGAATATLPTPFLTLSGEFPIIARRLLHRPIPYQAKEPRV